MKKLMVTRSLQFFACDDAVSNWITPEELRFQKHYDFICKELNHAIDHILEKLKIDDEVEAKSTRDYFASADFVLGQLAMTNWKYVTHGFDSSQLLMDKDFNAMIQRLNNEELIKLDEQKRKNGWITKSEVTKK